MTDEPSLTLRKLVRDLMTVGVPTCPPHTPVVDLVRLMLEKNWEAVVVLDGEEGHALGVVGQDEIVRAYERDDVRALTAEQIIHEGVPQIPPDVLLTVAAQMVLEGPGTVNPPGNEVACGQQAEPPQVSDRKRHKSGYAPDFHPECRMPLPVRRGTKEILYQAGHGPRAVFLEVERGKIGRGRFQEGYRPGREHPAHQSTFHPFSAYEAVEERGRKGGAVLCSDDPDWLMPGHSGRGTLFLIPGEHSGYGIDNISNILVGQFGGEGQRDGSFRNPSGVGILLRWKPEPLRQLVDNKTTFYSPFLYVPYEGDMPTQRTLNCVAVSSYIINGHPDALYQAREQAYLSMGLDLDLYGRRWHNWPQLNQVNYQGEIGGHKVPVMAQYRQAIVFENSVVEGYASEKYWDAKAAGVEMLHRGWIPDYRRTECEPIAWAKRILEHLKQV